LPLSGKGVSLARYSSNDDIHDSTPRDAIEGGKIRPDRRVINEFVLHASFQDFAARDFPLNVADCSSMRHNSLDSNADAVDSATQGQHVEGIRIHTVLPR
jgi:hypothetical protein